MVKRINQMSSPIKSRNLTLAPIKSTNLTSSSIKNRNLTLAPIKILTRHKILSITSSPKHKQDTKPNIKPNEGHEQDVKPNIKFDKITYEEEKLALILGIASIFTVWWTFK